MRRKILNVAVVQYINAPYKDETYVFLQDHYPVKLHIANFCIEDNHPEWEYKNKDNNACSSLKDFLKNEKKPIDAIIISGYSEKISRNALIYSKIHAIPIIMMADSVESFHLNFLKKKIYKHIDAFWVPGERSKKYFLSKGVDNRKIFTGGYTYNYKDIRDHLKLMNRKEMREQFGFQESDFVFLFIGKLIPSRRVSDLVDAFVKIEEKNIKIIIIGDGEDKAYIETASNSDTRIISIAKVNLEHLNDYFVMADAYIHPGKEPYSCAVMQAAAAALPVIATEEVGAIDDFLINGENGIVIPLGNIVKIREAILSVYKNIIKYKENAVKTQKYVCENLSIEFAAKQLYKAITQARGCHLKKNNKNKCEHVKYCVEDIAAIVISFNGDNISNVIKSLLKQIGHIIVVDNASDSKYLKELGKYKGHKDITIIYNSDNKGQAQALNQGWHKAEELGYPLVLTMDQDSVIGERCVSELLKWINSGFDSVGPNYINKYFRHQYKNVRYLITSGNLLKVESLKKINGYNRDLFIDSVDFDLCLRLRQAGYRLALIRDAKMQHFIGDAIQNENGEKIFEHSVKRHYYIARNHYYIIKKYFSFDPVFCIKKQISYCLSLFQVRKESKAKEKFRARKLGKKDSKRLL